MPDPTDPTAPTAPVGSVAQETARLLEALLGPSVGPAPEPAAPDTTSAPAGDQPAPCPTCGHTGSGTEGAPGADVCRVCPVCQVLRAVRAVRPETLDRLADLAAAVTETLRDAAAHRWHESPPADGHPPRWPPGGGSVVEDIRVSDSHEPDDLHDADDLDDTDELEDVR